jgi:hypothetical protein
LRGIFGGGLFGGDRDDYDRDYGFGGQDDYSDQDLGDDGGW